MTLGCGIGMWHWDVAWDVPTLAHSRAAQQVLLDLFGICQHLSGSASLAQHPKDFTQAPLQAVPNSAKPGEKARNFHKKEERERERERG